jgi:hypothetical protein
MKKPIYIYAIALVIAGLMISGATAAFIQPVSEKTIAKKTYSAATMTVASKVTEKAFANAQPVQAATLSEEQARSFTWFHKYSPACAESHDGVVASAHRFQRDDVPYTNIVGWCGSAWDAVRDWYPYPPGNQYQRLFNMWWPPNNNWSSVLYWTDSNGCKYPTMEFRGFNNGYPEFVGSMVSVDVAPSQGRGWSSGMPFVTLIHNQTYPNVREAYDGYSWFYNASGFYGMKSVDIACDTTDDQFWRWGVESLVISNQSGLQDAPALFFEYEELLGRSVMSYFLISGAETTHCDIDEGTQMAYSVYDYYSAENFQYELFCREDNWAEMKQYTGVAPNDEWWTWGVSWSFEAPELGIREPAVATGNGNVVVVFELTNDTIPNDHDILCFYTPDGNVSHFNQYASVVAGSTTSEKHPEIQWVGGNSFICAFYNNSKVYRSRSNDGGATWSTPVLVSGTDNCFDDHGCVDITNGGTKIFWTKIEGNTSWVLNCARLETHVEVSVDDIWDAATTCPAGDAIYNYITVTVWDANGNPVPGIPAANFAFTVTPQGAGLPWVYPYTPRAQWFGTFGATFVAVDPVTDVNGKIRFTFLASTSMKGDVLITATVNGQPINDRERLPCKSPDYDINGAVALADFITFGQDWGKYKWRSDFSGDGGLVGLPDFIVFGQHWAH